MKQNLLKVLSIALTMLLFLTFLPVSVLAGEEKNAGFTIRATATLWADPNYGDADLLYYASINGKTLPAYCIDHGAWTPDGIYSSYSNASNVLGYIMKHGYNNNSWGLGGAEAQYLTQAAVDAYLRPECLYNVVDGQMATYDLYCNCFMGSKDNFYLAEQLAADAQKYAASSDARYATFWSSSIDGMQRVVVPNPIVYCSVSVAKLSTNPKMTDGNACYSLAGAQFGLYTSAADASNDTNRVALLTTDATGKASVSNVPEPSQGFWMRELEAPKGFELPKGADAIQSVTYISGTTNYTFSFEDKPLNDPFTIKISKKSSDEGYVYAMPLEGTEFTVNYYANTEGNTTGNPLYTWVVATDSSNQINMTGTKTGGFVHGSLVSGELFYNDADIIIWPIGTYEVFETKASAGYTLEDNEIISQDGTTYKNGEPMVAIITGNPTTDNVYLQATNYLTVNNYPVEIRTTARNGKNQTHYFKSGDNLIIEENIDIHYLGSSKYPTRYRLVSTLMNRDTGEQIQQTEQTWTTDDYSSVTKNAVFAITDTSTLDGATLVVYEDLYAINPDKDEVLIAQEHDPTNEDQSLHAPSIKTTLADDKGNKEIPTDAMVKLIDTVEYRGLIIGKTYELTANLVDAQGEALEDDNGEILTATATFTATRESGSIDVVFDSFEGVTLGGKSAICFEELKEEGRNFVLAEHKDLGNQEQRIEFRTPEINTTMTDDNTGTHFSYIQKNMTYTDVVAYSNLAQGVEYTLVATLMDAFTEEAIQEATATFTASANDGTAEVKFKLDGTTILKHPALVCFEELYYKYGTKAEKIIASHKNMGDKNQEVTMICPEIFTVLLDTETKMHLTNGCKEINLVDSALITNTIAGKEYIVKATLMSAKTGEPIIDCKGEIIETEQKIIAEGESIFHNIPFTMDERTAQNLRGDSIVCFEELLEEYENEDGDAERFCLASHKDIENTNQTVRVPYISTKLTTTNQKKTFTPEEGKALKLNDRVELKNLEIFKEEADYIIKGYIVNKENGEYLKSDGTTTKNKEEAISSSVRFLPKENNEYINVPFEIKNAEKINYDLVCFEELYIAIAGEGGETKEEIKIAEHTDTNDKEQTLTYVNAPKTGDRNSWIVWLIVAALLSSLLGCSLRLINRK